MMVLDMVISLDAVNLRLALINLKLLQDTLGDQYVKVLYHQNTC